MRTSAMPVRCFFGRRILAAIGARSLFRLRRRKSSELGFSFRWRRIAGSSRCKAATETIRHPMTMAFSSSPGVCGSPMHFEAIAHAEPLTPISSYRATENRLRHYERLRVWPERFLVMGDAVCAFNPVYGQGMTAAAMASENLQDCLARKRTTLD